MPAVPSPFVAGFHDALRGASLSDPWKRAEPAEVLALNVHQHADWLSPGRAELVAIARRWLVEHRELRHVAIVEGSRPRVVLELVTR
jgi:hypothetical protein